MIFNLIMSVLIATHFTPLSEDKILVCYHDEYGSTVSQIWTFKGDTITKGVKYICTMEKNVTPISVKCTGKNTFEMTYGKEKTIGVINGETITYLDFGRIRR